jgi:hypothetical protein
MREIHASDITGYDAFAGFQRKTPLAQSMLPSWNAYETNRQTGVNDHRSLQTTTP